MTLAPPPRRLVGLPSAAKDRHDAGVVSRFPFAPAVTVDPGKALILQSFQPGLPEAEEEIARRKALEVTYTLPELEIVRLFPGWIETVMCVAITTRGEYVVDTQRQDRQAVEQGYRIVGAHEIELPDRPVGALEGAAVLAGLPTGGNYFHWLFEAVVRVLIAREQLDKDLPLLVPALRPLERDALRAAGVSDDQLLELPERSLVSLDEVFVPPRGVRSGVRILPDAVRVLRGLAPPCASPTARIFVSRAGAWRRSTLTTLR